MTDGPRPPPPTLGAASLKGRRRAAPPRPVPLERIARPQGGASYVPMKTASAGGGSQAPAGQPRLCGLGALPCGERQPCRPEPTAAEPGLPWEIVGDCRRLSACRGRLSAPSTRGCRASGRGPGRSQARSMPRSRRGARARRRRRAQALRTAFWGGEEVMDAGDGGPSAAVRAAGPWRSGVTDQDGGGGRRHALRHPSRRFRSPSTSRACAQPDTLPDISRTPPGHFPAAPIDGRGSLTPPSLSSVFAVRLPASARQPGTRGPRGAFLRRSERSGPRR